METEHSHPGEPTRYCVETPDGHPVDAPEWLTLPEIIQAYPEQRPDALDKLRLLAPGEFWYDADVKRTFTRPKRVRVMVAIDIDCVDERDVDDAMAECFDVDFDLSAAASAMDIANVEILEVKS